MRQGRGWFVTLLWFVCIGSWLSALWSLVVWLLIISMIGLPLANRMLNRLPQIGALQPPLESRLATDVPPTFWLWRVVSFVFFGWWLSFVWLLAAWLVALTLVGIPLAIAMWNRTPAITTLARR